MKAQTDRRTASGSRSGFTLIELMIVTVIIAILAAVAIPAFQKILVRAHVNSVVADGRILLSGFQEFYADNYAFPNATSAPVFNLQTMDPLTSEGLYQGNMLERLDGGQATAYDSPDDDGNNQEFWVVLTLAIDPSYQVVVASSDDAPISAGGWMEGVYTFRDGTLIAGPGGA